jgi:RNA polymerase sigma-70 factor (ECF subfamily)
VTGSFSLNEHFLWGNAEIFSAVVRIVLRKEGTRMEQEIAEMNREAVRLIQQFLGGDSRSFHSLVQLFGQRLSRLVRKMVHSYHDVEDLYNEIWLRVAQNLHKFDPNLPFHSWLFRIAANACIDFLRKKKEIAMEDDLLLLQVGKSSANQSATPENLLLEKEFRTQLEYSLARLDETDRLILTLRFAEGMSYDDIGSIVGMSKNTVGTRLFRARKQLKELLHKHLEERRMADAAY